MVILEAEFKNRKKEILEKVVSCYLEKGQPIASEFLVMRYHLKISPATIRNEFQELSKDGYLYKCHISSGRIPTDKALKFFIGKILNGKEVEVWKRRWYEKMKEKIRVLNNLERTIDFLANETRAFSFFYLPEEEMVVKKGMKYLFGFLDEELEKIDCHLIKNLAESLENFDNQIRKIEINSWPVIYIGKENPLVRADNLSFLINHARSKPLIFGILGSKRMPYERNLGLLQAMAEIF
ncbi:MAG: hypothetical protein ACP5OX_01285 [Minisyncoccia bacterium]